MPFIDNGGVKIRYEVEGDGPPLVLMHATTSRLENLRRNGVVDALKTDYRLILPDARGHGESDKPHEPTAYLPEQRAGDVTVVLDDLEIDTAHYMGYSGGGRIGLDLCAVAPERLRSLIVGGAGPAIPPMAQLTSRLLEKLPGYRGETRDGDEEDTDARPSGS